MELDALRVTTVRTEQELAALSVDYRTLIGAMPVVLPFQLPEWHVTWWRTFATKSLAVRDSLRVLVVHRGARCVAIAPFFASERPAIGPLRLRMLQLFGADPNFTEIRSVLFDPSYEEVCARKLLAHLHTQHDWDLVTWSGVGDGTGLARVLAEDRDASWSVPNVHFVLDLPKTFEELRKSLKRNIRESLRHGYNSLKREGHAFELQVAESPAAVAEALPHFYELHRQRATLGETVRHADRFALRGGRAFLDAIADSLSPLGVFKVFTLRVAGAVVAVRIGFVQGKQLYLYYSGFDPAWARYGVMTTTLAETIRWAIDRGLTSIDLSTGNDVSKTRWAPRAIGFHDVMQPHASNRGALAAALLSTGDRLRAGPLGKLLPVRRWE